MINNSVEYKCFLFNGLTPPTLNTGHSPNKKCRFCGKSEPEVTFSHKSHAISECLGNTIYYCDNECDECNSAFSKIENDAYRFNSLYLLLSGSRGKTGFRTITSTNEISRILNEKDNIIVKSTASIDKTLKKIEETKTIHLESGIENKFIPQNVYKCYCKYVISMMPNELCDNFRQCISWIFDNKSFVKQLPQILICDCLTQEQPRLVLFIRLTENANCPYCFAGLSISDKLYLFIVPCDNDDLEDGISQTMFDNFKQCVNKFFPLNLNWKECNLSKSRKQRIRFGIDISNVEIGKTVFVIDNYNYSETKCTERTSPA